MPTVILARVTCYEECATIVEVAYQSKAIVKREESAEVIKKKNESEKGQLEERLKQLQKERLIITENITSLENEKLILRNFSNSVSIVSGLT